MSLFLRTATIFLGVFLMLGWSSATEAFPKNKRSSSSKSSSKRSSSSRGKSKSFSKSKSSSSRGKSRSSSKKSYRKSSKSRSGKSGYSRPRSGSSRSRSHAKKGGSSSRSRSHVKTRSRYKSKGSKNPSKRGTVNKPRSTKHSRVYRTYRSPTASRGKTPVVAVPTRVKRGNKTFHQKAEVKGGDIYVTRSSSTAYHGQTGGAPGTQGVHGYGGHHGHHGHHDNHYHHHHWGHGHYYCYMGFWTFNPWFWGFYWAPAHVAWHHSWWWAGDPWYGYWGWYYRPYPVYDGPSYWVTDYTLARMLEDEYARGYADGYADGQEEAQEGAPITEEVKEQIRTQVDDVARSFQEEEWLALEKVLEDPDYMFIVDTPLSVTTDEGETCTLTGGDIFRCAEKPNPEVPVASMMVVTSKSNECAAGSVVSVSLSDLQEMLNTFGQTVDDGLNELQKQQELEREED